MAGEITSSAKVACEAVARRAIPQVGYVDQKEPFAVRTVAITNLISSQSGEISRAVGRAGDAAGQLGAGDQGMMMSY